MVAIGLRVVEYVPRTLEANVELLAAAAECRRKDKPLRGPTAVVGVADVIPRRLCIQPGGKQAQDDKVTEEGHR